MYLAGSYDNTAKLMDVRTHNCIQTVNHGAPIEDVIMFNTGTIYMTAGKFVDNFICIKLCH